MTSSWSRPLLLIAVSCSWVASPSRSVKRPPAASTIGLIAARSYGGDPDGVDRDIDRSLGDEHVLPEVTQTAAPSGALLRG